MSQGMYYESLSKKHMFHNKTPLALFPLHLCWTTCCSHHNKSYFSELSTYLMPHFGASGVVFSQWFPQRNHPLHHFSWTDVDMLAHHQLLSLGYSTSLMWFSIGHSKFTVHAGEQKDWQWWLIIPSDPQYQHLLYICVRSHTVALPCLFSQQVHVYTIMKKKPSHTQNHMISKRQASPLCRKRPFHSDRTNLILVWLFIVEDYLWSSMRQFVVYIWLTLISLILEILSPRAVKIFIFC